MGYRELISLFDESAETAAAVLNLILQKIGLSAQEILHLKTGMQVLQENQLIEIKKYIKRYTAGQPIQYILEQSHFRGLTLAVHSGVLIPRPETEELIDLVVNDYKGQPIKTILDIGTGSGNIAISLKKEFPDAQVHALDISSEAIALAAANAVQNKADIHFVEGDILSENIQIETMFDVIISNPPYIPLSRKNEMHPTVYDYEPNIALFVPDEDPLLFYKKILDFASVRLSKNGKVYFETSQYEYLEIYNDWKIASFTDMSGNIRFLRASIAQ